MSVTHDASSDDLTELVVMTDTVCAAYHWNVSPTYINTTHTAVDHKQLL